MNTPQQNMTVEQALAQAHGHWNAGQVDQAERLCQQVLALWPGQSDALHLMGLMAHAYGNLDLAIDHLRHACLAPRAPAQYLSNLAEMCRQAGRLAEAEQAARRSVSMDSSLVAGWNNLGIVLQEAGKLEESLTCLERVVALQPDYAEAHNNLGNTLKRLGRLDQARARYEQALKLAPAYAEALSNLSNLLNDLGLSDEALASARRAIDANPRLSDAYINAAAVEVARDRYDEGLRWVDALLVYAPLHAGALGVRATILRRLGRLDEALVEARRALATAPDNGEALNTLGEVLQAQDKMDEALAAYDRAAQSLGFAPEKALVNRAILLMERGDTEAAKAAFDDVLEHFPRSASAWFNRADLHRFVPGDPAIGAMEALIGPGGVQNQADRTALHFALGKAWMDVGDAERAFRYLDEGNRQKRATFAYDPNAIDRWFSDIIAAFPSEMIQRPEAATPGSDLAVFVIGMPRSGTTLVEQILASHPDVLGAGEMTTLQNIVNTAGGYPAIAQQLTPENEAALGGLYLDAVRPLAGDHHRLVDKMPSNFLFAGLINRILPQARIIHVRRDPADTCLSSYSRLFSREQLFCYDQSELARFYQNYERLMDHWRAVLPADRFIEVRYEDLVDDIEHEARRLTDFCGLDWSPACLDFHQTSRTIRTASLNQVRRPLYASSIGRWRAYARQLGPLLTGLGIDPEAVAAPTVGRKTAAGKRAGKGAGKRDQKPSIAS
uniref:Sulfotransferase n=1 Tax=Caulobacter sp. (strain K31) TaxID=366602 RepID=B0T4N2_CAUSK